VEDLLFMCVMFKQKSQLELDAELLEVKQSNLSKDIEQDDAAIKESLKL